MVRTPVVAPVAQKPAVKKVVPATPKPKVTQKATPRPTSTATKQATPVQHVESGKPWATEAVRLCIRQHESGGNYRTNTGNHYYGAYQFSRATWTAVTGLSGTADQYGPAIQDAAFRKIANEVETSASMQNQFTTWAFCH